ncbi:histidine phosphatase family protein [Thiomicrospira microaerophila]|uniref:histidine phosphatase family protein n=1 Tax=Thiomicrospira microaerophila TaxID=406020 RepID=UPI002010ACD4|nr:histidine phosphatase family protein [Thiomicrospira microaerophila]UQB41913.1 histidine phosphatase family protein [Thiomicrospira microaerophila]
MKRWLVVFFCLFVIWLKPALAEDEFKDVVKASPQLIDALRQGGFVIYMRHGKTDTKQPDQVPIDLNDCATQRPLSAEGLVELEMIARHFKQLNLPYQAVLTSPLCRAKQTAEIVFNPPLTIDMNLQYTAALTTQQKQPIIQRTLELLSEPVVGNTNRVLVAHGPNLVEVMQYFPPEGSLVFFRPLASEGFEYLATLSPNDWPVVIKQLGY